MRYYLDEDQSQVIAHVAHERYGLDITASHDVGMDHAPDSEQLRFAAGQGHCIVTRNGDDFIRLTRRFLEEGLAHAGVLIVPESMRGDDFGAMAAALAYHHLLYPDNIPYYTDFLHHAPIEDR
ncbi:MAG: DUF5615 family PIN-like protein [Dehalococcoidia bacterium]